MTNPSKDARRPELVFTGHALKQMFARGISPADVQSAVEGGEAIAEYPDDTPHPSRLILGFVSGRPVHVVLATDRRTQAAYVVTAYVPDASLWEPDFRKRKKP
jgi:hypothetical protein